MVIYGLVPHEELIRQVVEDIAERFKLPQFKDIHEMMDNVVKIQAIKDYRVQKPYNKYFVYKVNTNGKLEITHVSFEVMRVAYKLTKPVQALQILLQKNIRGKYLKSLLTILARQNRSLSVKEQARVEK